MKRFVLFFLAWSLSVVSGSECRLPALTPEIVNNKVQEIMQAHAAYKELSPSLVKRILQNYLEELDPIKSYFIETDIQEWLSPSDDLTEKVLVDYTNNRFDVFENIHKKMIMAIHRRHELEKQIPSESSPQKVNPKEFKDLKWAKSEEELLDRLSKIKTLQVDAAAKLNDELKEKSLQRIAKRQKKYEDDILDSNSLNRQKYILSKVLKATASSMDTHTNYFTPDEASQFMMGVQQRLFGIGVQLRDDLNGFTITKVVEGGPASDNKQLKLKDRIIAVNGEPVVGMDIVDAVELIRGPEKTPVTLTLIREIEEGKSEEKVDVTLDRGEVVLKESRYESSYEPFGDGVIAYLRLFSFYQDPDSSSSTDLAEAIEKLKKEHKVKGIILDLRYNSGGLLSQAVSVTGLFITKGVVATIKDSSGAVQHLRELDGKTVWDGPLIVLVNRASASASEIVAQTLQDYGRAVIVGDDHTYGKGSFQTFTLNTSEIEDVNPQGEYKVTRGRYYTVSGKSPQLTGVASDIVVPGILSVIDIGEKYAKYPLDNDQIKDNFDDDLADVPFLQREKIRLLYKFNLQPRLETYAPFLEKIRSNSTYRIDKDKNYQNFLKEIQKEELADEDSEVQFGQNDLQLIEANNIMKDLIILMN